MTAIAWRFRDSQLNDHCPPGYRLLIQLTDAATYDDARNALMRMFGLRGLTCVVRPGCYRHITERSTKVRERRWVDYGYSAYVPI